MDNKEILRRALTSLFEAYRGRASEFMDCFAPDYVQWANGRRTTLNDLIERFDGMESTRPRRTIEFIDVISDGDVVFDQHVVTAFLPDGGTVVVDVFAKWTFENGRITGCEELTRQRDGTSDGP